MAAAGMEGVQMSCILCAGAIDADLEYITATCAKCGNGCFHVDCLTPLLGKIHHDSTRAMERARRLISNKPAFYMAEQKMRCPSSAECGGKIIDADMVKPFKAPPPPPPGLPLPAGKPKNRAGPAAGGAAGVAAAAAGPSALSKRQQKQQQQQQRATAARVAASASPSYASLSPNSGQSGSGGSRDFLQGSILKFPVGKRPVELQMCAEFMEDGQCYFYNCERCHGPEEMAARERAWLARQEAKKGEKRQEELARHEREREARKQSAQWEQQVAAREAEKLEHEEHYLHMGDAALKLMKDHKRGMCVATLVDMGFDPGIASLAADASACDVSAAAALLMEGQVATGIKPISVTGEAQELLGYAASLGLGLAEVEMALVLSAGDWDQASMQLHQQAEQAVQSRSAAEAAVAAAAAAAAGSREQADLAAALQASASGAAMAYNISQQAAAAAAAAREAAEVAAAIEASKAEAAAKEQQRRQQQQYSLPWASTPGGQADWGAPAVAPVAAPPHPPQQPPQQQQLQQLGETGSSNSGGGGGGGGGALWYDASAKHQMPEYRGGWDVGPTAVVAAASGRSSAASPAPPPMADPWQPPQAPPAVAEPWQQQPPQQQPAAPKGLAASPVIASAAGGGYSSGLSAGLAAAAGGPAAAAASANHHHQPQQQQQFGSTSLAAALAAVQPAPADSSTSTSSSTSIWASQPQLKQPQHLALLAPAQQPSADAELDELMQMMGLGGA